MPGVIEQQRRLRLREPLVPNELNQVRNRLLEYENVSKVEAHAGTLVVDYRFPLVTLETIIGVIEQTAGTGLFPPLQRFRNGLYVLKETNAGDYLNNHYGWQRYIEDIYVHEYQAALRQQTDARMQTWRKYKYD